MIRVICVITASSIRILLTRLVSDPTMTWMKHLDITIMYTKFSCFLTDLEQQTLRPIHFSFPFCFPFSSLPIVIPGTINTLQGKLLTYVHVHFSILQVRLCHLVFCRFVLQCRLSFALPCLSGLCISDGDY